MALPLTGELSLDDVNVELGITSGTTIRMGSSDVRGLFDDASGQIAMSQGYGKANVLLLTITSNIQELNIATYATANGWDGTQPVELTIASTAWIYSRTNNNGALTIPSSMTDFSLINNGKISGMGGSAGQPGGHAIINSSAGVTIQNNSGAYIAGGGGGGSGVESPGGGAGQWSVLGSPSSTPSSSSGSYLPGPGTCGSCVTYGTRIVGSGRPQGGDGANGRTNAGCCRSPSCTLCGGGVFFHYPAGAQGGSVLDGTNSNGSNGGGGGWGQAGRGGGGAAGQAVNGTSITLTNNGTVYGSVA